MKTVRINTIVMLFIILMLNMPFPSCAVKQMNVTGGNDLKAIVYHRDLGNLFYEKKQFGEAEREFNQVLEDDPNDLDTNYKMGVIYSKRGKIKESILQFLKVLTFDPYYTKAYYNLGAVYANDGLHYNAEKASFFFKKYIQLEPDSEHRKTIESWLSMLEKKTLINTNDNDPQKPKKGTGEDFKNWLKEKAGQIDYNE